MRERRESRKGLSWIMLAILLLAYMTIQGVSVVKASPTLPKIFVAPKINTAAPTQSFTIDINVSDISDTESLYGWDFEIRFNTTVLDAVNVVEGSFLKSVSSTFFSSQIDNPAGTVNALCMINYPYPAQGAVGGGKLCNITFQVGANGKTLLHFADTELDTIVGMNVVPISHEPSDGFFEYPLKVHDIAVTSVVPRFKGTVVSAAYRAWDLIVSVTIRNQGNATEAISVTAYYYKLIWHEIGTNVTNLASGTETTLTVKWTMASLTANTTYSLKAIATLIVDGVNTMIPDINPANNEFIYGQVKVRLWGDVDGSGDITILDLKRVKLAYSGLINEPFADLDGIGGVDILDLKKEKLLYSGLISPYGK